MVREIKTSEDPKNEVFKLALMRQQVEAEFAGAVYRVFNDGAALAKLQDLAGSELRLMVEGPVNAFELAIAKEPDLQLWDKAPKNHAGLTMWTSPVLLRRLDATDCADVIRLFGTWVEVGGFGGGERAHLPSKTHPNVAAEVKEEFRVGGIYNWGPDARNRGGGWDIEEHLVPYMRDPNARFSGMANRRARGNSNVLQLDRLFGLVVGCDISGTTADCLFALHQSVSLHELGLTEAYYMLPLGTIVHNMHHSLLEVALSASLNGLMDYHIGFFETLMPRQCRALPPELSGLYTAIANADSMMRMYGLHHLRYYEGSRPKGVFQFTDVHVTQFRNSPISEAVTMLDRAPCLGGYPQRHSVVELLRSAGMMM